MLSKCLTFRPLAWRRLARPFCSKVPAAAGPTGRAPGELREQPVTLDGHKLTVKFDENTVCYELPERIGGTTFGRPG